jgi:hypothetical protein
MIKRYLWVPLLGLLTIGLIACSQMPSAAISVPANSTPSPTVAASPAVSPTTSPTATNDLTQLFSHIWRVTTAPSQPASGSIYIFLPNGTLLETSCVETYRIATWTIDKAAPRTLRVVEDGQFTFTATIAQLSDMSLQLQLSGMSLQLEQVLVRINEKQDLTLTAVEQEFACPDLPK